MTRARDLADSADKDISGTLTLDDIVLSNDMTVADNGKVIFGAGSDLQIFHDGSHSYISDQGTGHLKVFAESFYLNNASDTEQMIGATVNGAVDLFYNGSKKFETTSDGVTVTGDLKVTSGTDAQITINDNVGEVGSGNLALQVTNSAGSALKPMGFRAEDIRFATGSSERMRIESSGKVGIGSTSVTSSVFEVQGGTTNQVNIVHANNTGWGLLLTNSDSSNNGDYHYSTSGNNTSCAVINVSDDALHFGTNNDRRMTIDHVGNIGIGTADPSRLQYGSTDPRLHVKGAGTSGYTLAARFENGNDSGNDRGSAILVNHSNDRGILIEGGRGTGDQGVGMLSVISSGASRTECIRLSQITTSHASVTMPSQPHFIAYTSSAMSYTGGSGYDIIDNFSTLTNQGNHFSTSNGRFTAPVTGTYFFGFQLLLQNVNSGDDSIHIAFYKNGSNDVYANLRAPGSSANGSVGYGAYLPVIGHNVVRLSANDIYDIRLSSSGSMSVYSSQGWSRYWGYLLG